MPFMRGSHPSYGSSVLGAAARASRTPRWKLASLLRTSSAERAGAPLVFSLAAAAEGSPTDPGTRFARGTRRGRPAEVVVPVVGAATDSAARQPSSAGECHSGWAAGADWAPVPPAADGVGAWVESPRRNQSDSRESKIGSRCEWPFSGGAGTRTSPLVPLVPLAGPEGAGGTAGSGPVPLLPKPPDPAPDWVKPLKLPVPGPPDPGWAEKPPVPAPAWPGWGGWARGPPGELNPRAAPAPLAGRVGSACGPLPCRGCGVGLGG